MYINYYGLVFTAEVHCNSHCCSSVFFPLKKNKKKTWAAALFKLTALGQLNTHLTTVKPPREETKSWTTCWFSVGPGFATLTSFAAQTAERTKALSGGRAAFKEATAESVKSGLIKTQKIKHWNETKSADIVTHTRKCPSERLRSVRTGARCHMQPPHQFSL